MKTIVFVFFLSGCGLGVHGYGASYTASTPYYNRGSERNWRAEEHPYGTEIAVPVSPLAELGCDPSFQLGFVNQSRNHDAVVNIHRMISDGTTQATTVSVPRGGERVVCLPDVGSYELEFELFAMTLGEPRRVGCYTRQREITAFVGVAGRHVQNITDESARGGRC